MTSINGAIFDMDGTLIDSLMVWDVIWEEFGKRFQNGKKFLISKSDDKAVRTMTLKDAMNHIHQKYNIGKTGEELLETVNKIMIDFYSNEVMLKEGVTEFLEYCSANGVKLCIASATDSELI